MEGKKKGNLWLTLATFIVDKRKAIEILFVIAMIYSILCVDKVRINQDITSYLPAESETRRGLTVMEDEFITYGSARVMVANVTYDEAEELTEKIRQIGGVKEVVAGRDKDHYTGSNALYDVTVEGENEDLVSIGAIRGIRETLSGYDVYVSTTVGQVEESAEMLDREMSVILILSVAIIVAVLLLSTKAYLEIPVLLITFGVAAVLNMGTNFWFEEISFVTNSIAVVLQLALAIDYAIILCDRFMEEHETMDAETAVKIALSKAIPEISASSLTTISGMIALMLMQFKLGYDMGIVLVKAIVFSLISVFFLMPGILLIFAKGIDRTHHKCFVPKITFVGKLAAKTKFIVPPIFLVVVVLAFFGSSNCRYVFDINSVEGSKKSASKIAAEKVEEVFGKQNQLVVMVPSGNYEMEASVLGRLEQLPFVTSALGLANQEINDDYVLTEKITPRQFAEMTEMDIEIIRVLYSAYAYSQEQYGPVITGIDDYGVPIIDMFLFLYDQYQEGYVTLSDEMDKELGELYDTLHDGQMQLQGENYSRFVINMDKPGEGQETYDAMEEIRELTEQYYGRGTVILAGNSTSAYDLETSFATDNIIISVMTALFVMVILFFTFQSAGLPVLLVLTIQGSIWINFSIPAIQGQNVYFIAYLIVSAIQMGATIDYAIVISSRYMQLKNEMPIQKAMIETLNQAFPTIFTSGSIMTCSGFLIGNISTDATVSAMGVALGRGTLTSIVLVLFVLPQILLLGDVILEKTALTIRLPRAQREANGQIRVNGRVRGYVEGEIDAYIQGTFRGQMKVSMDTLIPGRQGELTESGEPGHQGELTESEGPGLPCGDRESAGAPAGEEDRSTGEPAGEEGGSTGEPAGEEDGSTGEPAGEEGGSTGEPAEQTGKAHGSVRKTEGRKKKHRLLLAVGICILLWPSKVMAAQAVGEDPGRTEENVLISAGEAAETSDGAAEAAGEEQPEEDIFWISTADDLRQLGENCRYDTWSYGRVVRLNADLDLSGEAFAGIAYFNGIFEGNGHEIKGVFLDPKGSDYGFFRYIGEQGEVKNLLVTGTVRPTGSQEQIGGLVGVNYGLISECSFQGRVDGLSSVGAIAGINKTTGSIISCTSDAVVFATDDTGGIVGVNEGFVDACTSKSSVNTEELEPTLDLAGMDLGSLNLTQSVVTRNNTGGIAGRSTGVINKCVNEGLVGFRHSGYNVGGIAGCQSGIISGCDNFGTIYGRKDVGGIVGQAEPFVESEYLEDKVRQTQDDLGRLGNTLNQISATVGETSAKVRHYADDLDRQYTDAFNALDQNLDDLTGAAAGNPDAQGHVDNINAARNRIHEIYASGGPPTEEELAEVRRQLETISENVGNLQGTYSGQAQSPEELTKSISEELSARGESGRTQTIKDFVNTVDNGIQSVVRNMKQAVNQMNEIADSVSDDLAILSGDEEIITDISSLESAKQTDGVITDCVNHGEIWGDLNAGGIAGTMNIEYEGDPEFDFRFRESVNIRLRSTVNNVMLRCVNNGAVTVKRNFAGGIAGLQELGFIYGCEAYGSVRSEAGNYLGGIAGESAGAIEKCYSLCNLTGTDYVGGICGNGYQIRDCVSAVHIESEGERIGSVAGCVRNEGTVSGNCYVEDGVYGIDQISYAGVAERASYDEIMALEGIPEAFRRVKLTFWLEGQQIGSMSAAYGGTVTEAEFPQVPEKEGCYVRWNVPDELTDIRRNMAVTAEYVLWKESIAWREHTVSGETPAETKPVFLAVGAFYEESGLSLTRIENPDLPADGGIPAYAYSWELTDLRGKEIQSVEGHFQIPETEGEPQLWIRQENSWQQAAAVVDGSYLVAELPHGAEFAVTMQQAEENGYLLNVVMISAALLLAAIWLGHRYRRKHQPSQQG